MALTPSTDKGETVKSLADDAYSDAEALTTLEGLECVTC
jgi:hypothetical protein